MYNHAPENYQSPFVLARSGMMERGVMSRKEDFIYDDGVAMALICSSQFVGTAHEGHVLVMPNESYENIFDLPQEVAHKLADLVQAVSKAMMGEYKCDGLTIQQNNGPAGGQEVWHYHTHIIPRVDNDSYTELLSNMESSFKTLEPQMRAKYARRLRTQLKLKVPCT